MLFQFDGRTNRGKSRKSYGGVGRNIAASLTALGVENTKFITVVGDDEPGLEIFGKFDRGGNIKKMGGNITARFLYNFLLRVFSDPPLQFFKIFNYFA